MPCLKIVKCNDPLKWYSKMIGETVDFVGIILSPCEYRSYEPSGLVNFVHINDARIIFTFDEWAAENSSKLDCEAAESGMDREMDFDRGAWEDGKYKEYVKSM